MAKRGVKKKDHERLDDVTVSRVIFLLEQDKPITKKEACERLNISYNTKRLGDIIDEYNTKIEFTRKRFAANKGRSFSEIEVQELVADYLNGESITQIAEALYRTIHVVKNKIIQLGLPERTKAATYFNPDLIPDEAVSETFDIGELIWSARYNAVAEIRQIWGITKFDSGTFLIFVFGKHNEFAYQPWWELGKLEIVKELKIPVEKFIKTEKPNFNYRIN